jgi:hypothetical protein
MTSKEQDNTIPHMKIGPNDISVIGSVLMGYIGYLRNTARTAQTTKRIQKLHNLRQRILLLGSNEGNATLITEDDVTAICDAMITFVKVTRQLVPKSQEREETLSAVNMLRKQLEQHFLS